MNNPGVASHQFFLSSHIGAADSRTCGWVNKTLLRYPILQLGEGFCLGITDIWKSNKVLRILQANLDTILLLHDVSDVSFKWRISLSTILALHSNPRKTRSRLSLLAGLFNPPAHWQFSRFQTKFCYCCKGRVLMPSSFHSIFQSPKQSERGYSVNKRSGRKDEISVWEDDVKHCRGSSRPHCNTTASRSFERDRHRRISLKVWRDLTYKLDHYRRTSLNWAFA